MTLTIIRTWKTSTMTLKDLEVLDLNLPKNLTSTMTLNDLDDLDLNLSKNLTTSTMTLNDFDDIDLNLPKNLKTSTMTFNDLLYPTLTFLITENINYDLDYALTTLTPTNINNSTSMTLTYLVGHRRIYQSLFLRTSPETMKIKFTSSISISDLACCSPGTKVSFMSGRN